MRRTLQTATGVVAALALAACASADPAPTSAPSAPSASATTEVSSAAYVDVTTGHDPLAQVADATGLREVVLGFVLADSGEAGRAGAG